jgi:hypothetical protein
MPNHVPPPPAFTAPRNHPPPETAERGADLCREAIGLPVKHTLPLAENCEDEKENDDEPG